MKGNLQCTSKDQSAALSNMWWFDRPKIYHPGPALRRVDDNWQSLKRHNVCRASISSWILNLLASPGGRWQSHERIQFPRQERSTFQIHGFYSRDLLHGCFVSKSIDAVLFTLTLTFSANCQWCIEQPQSRRDFQSFWSTKPSRANERHHHLPSFLLTHRQIPPSYLWPHDVKRRSSRLSVWLRIIHCPSMEDNESQNHRTWLC